MVQAGAVAEFEEIVVEQIARLGVDPKQLFDIQRVVQLHAGVFPPAFRAVPVEGLRGLHFPLGKPGVATGPKTGKRVWRHAPAHPGIQAGFPTVGFAKNKPQRRRVVIVFHTFQRVCLAGFFVTGFQQQVQPLADAGQLQIDADTELVIYRLTRFPAGIKRQFGTTATNVIFKNVFTEEGVHKERIEIPRQIVQITSQPFA